MQAPDISWKRIFVEGSAIIASILLAFAIDAAWDDKQQRDDDMAQLQSLHNELLNHRGLLAEGMEAHNNTVQRGVRLLNLLAADPDAEGAEELSGLITGVLGFYGINAPFGALHTAISSGAIARMDDKDLASALASWPVSIDDLIEEQVLGGTIRTDMFMEMGNLVSLHKAYENRLVMPTVRGVEFPVASLGINADDLPDLPLPDYAALFGNASIANQLTYLIILAQAAHGESLIANEKLDGLIESLGSCLDAGTC